MSKKTKSTNTTFTYTPSCELPKLSKVKTKWDLKTLFYNSHTDPQIERDARTYERTCLNFAKKYRNEKFITTVPALLKALKDYEALELRSEGAKVIRYFMYRFNLNVNDTVANKQLNQYSERFRKVSNELIFFSLALGKIPLTKQKAFMADKRLVRYHYFLKQAFEAAKYHLSEKEERILSLRSDTSSGKWTEAGEKIISNRAITYKGKNVHLPEALQLIDTLSWAEKGKLWELILDEIFTISEFSEHELTAVVTHEKISDELRGYKKPYSATVQAYENSEKSVEAMVRAISTKGFALSRKFYTIKAALHGKQTIPYVNKYDPIGQAVTLDFSAATEICRDVFYSIKNKYGAIFDSMLVNGQIDVYPKSGKRGGAFMSADIGLPTFVFLNHTDNFKSMETLAHEMGHAIHAERSKIQPSIYQDFSTTTAETASTLFEQLVLDKIFEQLSAEQKIAFLHDKLTRDMATVQRQIAFFNFELEMHEHIRTEGLATRDELAHMMQKALQSYLGKSVGITKKDGYSYVYIPHVRYGFYVYTYAYGHLLSNLMATNYQADKTYVDKIDEFLTAGSSDTVENIFKSIGINAAKVETFERSLERQAKEIEQLRKLTR